MRLCAFSIIILVLLAGCAGPGVDSRVLVIRGSLIEAYGKDAVVADSIYLCPSRSWVIATWKKWVFSQARKGLLHHGSRWDCDDFARSFHAFACEEFARTRYNGSAESVSIGQFYYVDDEKGLHAINAVYGADGQWFIDPQSGKEKLLSDIERSSAQYKGF